MADHVRRQIRDRVVTLLTGLATSGVRVFPSRVFPVGAEHLPGLAIYTTEEDAALGTLDPPRRSDRALALVVEARAQQTDAMDDTLDEMCKEVELALAADPTLAGLVHGHQLSRTEQEYSGEGEQPAGVATMTFAVSYSVAENAPDVPVIT